MYKKLVKYFDPYQLGSTKYDYDSTHFIKGTVTLGQNVENNKFEKPTIRRFREGQDFRFRLFRRFDIFL